MLQECVEHVAASLLHYLHTRALADSERTLFCATVKTMLDVVVPYLSSCFSRVFPGAAAGIYVQNEIIVGLGRKRPSFSRNMVAKSRMCTVVASAGSADYYAARLPLCFA